MKWVGSGTAVLICGLIGVVFGSEEDHKYESGEELGLWAARVGPLKNPFEAFNLFEELPYCRAEGAEEDELKKSKFFGDMLQGCAMTPVGIRFIFGVKVDEHPICSITMDDDARRRFGKAVVQQWVLTMYIDDMPMRGLVGPRAEKRLMKKQKYDVIYVYTHFRFSIATNAGQIVITELQMEKPVSLQSSDIRFTYSVEWHKSDLPFVDRYALTMESSFFASKAHWMAIINSVVILVLMVGIASRIVSSMLNADYQKYAAVMVEEESELDLAAIAAAESGWKQLSGDIFRKPPLPEILCACLGIGNHLIAFAICWITSSLVGNFYVTPGLLGEATCVVYAVTSFLCGYYSTGIFCRLMGSNQNFRATALVSSLGIPSIGFLLFVPINLFSYLLGSSLTISLGRIVKIALFWFLFCLPPSIGGSKIAFKLHRWARPPSCNPIARPIAKKSRAKSPVVVAAVGAVMPFGCIAIELYFVLTSFWGLKMYYVFDLLLVVFLLLLAVTACTSIVCSYVLLTAEDYRWRWTCWGCGAFTGVYVFAYTLFFYLFNTNITGVVQMLFYFAFSLLFCVVLSAICGSVGYTAASIFIRKMYASLKSD